MSDPADPYGSSILNMDEIVSCYPWAGGLSL